MTACQTHVIVGAGHAGGCAAREMRDAGFTGRIVMIGAEPCLPYERPPLSKDLLQGDFDTDGILVNPPQFYEDRSIEVLASSVAVGLSPGSAMVELSDGRQVAYDRLLLATGASPRRLRVPGADLPGVHYLRTVADALALRERLEPGAHVVVVGGGLIGLEVAASARTRGAQVTVIEAAGQLMGRVLPEAAAQVVGAIHGERGTEILLGNQVREIGRGSSGRLLVSCDGGDLAADTVVVGIGAEPNVGLALAAGLKVDDGIIVDSACATSAEGIYAAGDATRHHNPFAARWLRLESWQNAQSQARVAARSMCGLAEAYAEVPYIWSQQFDMNLQVAGFFEGAEASVLRGRYDSGGFIAFYTSQDRLIGAVALNRPRDLRIAQHLIARGIQLEQADLEDASVPLKTLLASG